MLEQRTSLEKAIDLLFALHAADGPLGVSDLGRALGMPRSSVHRLLATLARRRLVERDPDARYRPGGALVTLGLGVLDREPLVEAARPVLEAESRATGETAFLVVARGGRLLVLDKVERGGLLRVAPRIGEEVPVHATAVGKLHLAFAPDTVELPPPPWPVFTERTARNPKALEREVERARRRGFAENRDEWITGLAVVAAPVFANRRLAGCLVVAGPTSRLRTAGTPALVRRVTAAAKAVSERLEGTGGRTS